MKLRRKILALSGVLLAILCAALFVSLRLQREVHDEIAAGRDYHLPLGALLAEAEGAALGYQLNLAKAAGGEADTDVAVIEKRERDLVGRLVASLDKADALLARAVADPRNDVPDRIRLARIEGTLRVLRREATALEASGQDVIVALRKRDRASAAAEMADFARHEQVLATDIERTRRDIEQLAEDSINEVVGHEDQARQLSLMLLRRRRRRGAGPRGRGRHAPRRRPAAAGRRRDELRVRRHHGADPGDDAGRGGPAHAGLQPHGDRVSPRRTGSRTRSGASSTRRWWRA